MDQNEVDLQKIAVVCLKLAGGVQIQGTGM